MIKNKEELFEDDEDLDIQEYKGKDDVMLKTHENINQDLCGEIEKLDSGFVKLKLVTTHDMIADSQNLIHGGFIFSAADYAAMAAVNEKNVVLVASEFHFLSPVKIGDIVNYISKVLHKYVRKRNIHLKLYF
ncbi:MAG: hotdog domain-containing protein [Sulfurimonas sp.]|jgi:acyl-CoA thioesterase|nr:hotdog domain-containing protein [Sulfurimonas sp.]